MRWILRLSCWLSGHERVLVHESEYARTMRCVVCKTYHHESRGGLV